ncbi:MAG: hypothetical protein KA535_11200 [Azonexus sp.]|nr:hypothetical protein [Azonexus sp.]
MNSIQHNIADGYTVIYPDGVSTADRFEIHFQGFRGVIDRADGEPDPQVWERTLKWLEEKRYQLQRQRSLLNYMANATIYAGTLDPECADRLFAAHLREMVLSRLNEEANNYLDGTGTSRTNALSLLAKLHGIAPPKKRVTKPAA